MSNRPEHAWGPHQDHPVLAAGAPLKRARVAVVMLHGRGASAEDILGLADELSFSDVAYLAPQASGYSWYPFSFLAPLQQNEPALSSALQAVADVVGRISEAELPPERIVLLGFSQGACLALEYAVRNARRYGGVVGLSGGLIGPDGTARNYNGSFDGMPVFLGCSDIDPHIPLPRVEETGQVFKQMGAVVTKRIYPGAPHAVNQDEIGYVSDLIGAI